MSGEIAAAAETVAETIAEKAGEIVAENNASVENAEAVQAALIAASLEDNKRREIEDRFNSLNSRYDDLLRQLNDTIQRVQSCETTVQEMLAKITAAPPVLSIQTDSPLPPSPPAGAVVLPVAENPAPRQEPEKVETPPEPPIEKPRKKRHTII